MVNIIVRHDDAGGSGDVDDCYAQTQAVFFLVTFVTSLDAVDVDGDAEHYCAS